MRHEHLVVTVEAGLKDRIDDDLDEGESLEAWVADAVERKLAAESADESPSGGGRGGDGERGGRDDRGDRRSRDGRDRDRGTAADSGRGRDSGSRFATGGAPDENEKDGGDGDGRDDYDEGFEYVDDCAI